MNQGNHDTISQLALIMQMYPDDKRRRQELAARVAAEIPAISPQIGADALAVVYEWLEPMARQHRLQGITGRFLWVRRCGCLGFAVADGKAQMSGSVSASLSGGCWGSGSEGGSRGNPAFVGRFVF